MTVSGRHPRAGDRSRHHGAQPASHERIRTPSQSKAASSYQDAQDAAARTQATRPWRCGNHGGQSWRARGHVGCPASQSAGRVCHCRPNENRAFAPSCTAHSCNRGGRQSRGCRATFLGANDLGVLAEVDVGLRRVGVRPGEPLRDLLRRIARLPHLDFEGISFFPGHMLSADDSGIEALAGPPRRLGRIR